MGKTIITLLILLTIFLTGCSKVETQAEKCEKIGGVYISNTGFFSSHVDCVFPPQTH